MLKYFYRSNGNFPIYSFSENVKPGIYFVKQKYSGVGFELVEEYDVDDCFIDIVFYRMSGKLEFPKDYLEARQNSDVNHVCVEISECNFDNVDELFNLKQLVIRTFTTDDKKLLDSMEVLKNIDATLVQDDPKLLRRCDDIEQYY